MSHPTQPPAAEPPVRSTAIVSRASLSGVRALVESAVIAVAGSAALYLVGSVYVDAYYGRMSIDAASLNLPTSLVALQSLHAAGSIASYPIYLIVVSIAYQRLVGRNGRLADWFRRLANRLGRWMATLLNLIVVAPLVSLAIVESQRSTGQPSSVIGEVSGFFEEAVTLLLIYVVWLGFREERVMLIELRERRLVPVSLLFVTYLLSTLIGTAHVAVLQAETLMTGLADGSLEITLVMRDGARPVGDGVPLILVAVRPDGYYVVERQTVPPSRRPVAFVVPHHAVDSARIRRANEAGSFLDEMPFELATPDFE